MAKRLYLTTECVKLTIGFFGGIGGLTLREFMTHSKLSKVRKIGKAGMKCYGR